jgi:hypothetical protein
VEGGDGTGGLPHRRQAKERFGIRGLLMVGLSLYVVLLVLASFGLIPDGGKLIRPFHRLIDLILSVVHSFSR